MRVCLLIAAVFATPALGADWPVFRGNSAMTGVGSPKLPDQLEERWVFQTKVKDTIEGAPAVVDGVVYIASMDRHLYAVDLKTGKEIWSVRLAPMKASPAVRAGRIYVGDVEGKFYCLEAKTGQLVWSFETSGEIIAGANFHKERILIGSHDSTLYCLEADGKKAWELKIDGPVNGAAVVIGDRTFVAGCDSNLHVVDVLTGKSLGMVDLGGQAAATAAVVDDRVYVGTMSNTVIAVDWKKQKKAWEFEAPKRQQPFYASAAVTDQLVIAGSRDKKVYAIDRATGKERWNFLTEGSVDASPVVVGNRIYVGCLSDTGEFYVLDLATGKEIQKLEFYSAITGSVAVGPDCLIVGTEKGTLHCLGKK